MYPQCVPKLWTETIEEHRRAVHDVTLDTTAALVREHGLASDARPEVGDHGAADALLAWFDRQ